MYEIIKAPHVLMIGTNGKRTSGIVVRDPHHDRVKDAAFSKEWCVNDFVIARWTAETAARYGLSPEALDILKREVAALSDFNEDV